MFIYIFGGCNKNWEMVGFAFDPGEFTHHKSGSLLIFRQSLFSELPEPV
jgi:hypothetical protein